MISVLSNIINSDDAIRRHNLQCRLQEERSLIWFAVEYRESLWSEDTLAADISAVLITGLTTCQVHAAAICRVTYAPRGPGHRAVFSDTTMELPFIYDDIKNCSFRVKYRYRMEAQLSTAFPLWYRQQSIRD